MAVLLVRFVDDLVLRPGRDEGEVALFYRVSLRLLVVLVFVVFRGGEQHALAGHGVDDGVFYVDRYMLGVARTSTGV